MSMTLSKGILTYFEAVVPLSISPESDAGITIRRSCSMGAAPFSPASAAVTLTVSRHSWADGREGVYRNLKVTELKLTREALLQYIKTPYKRQFIDK